MVHSFIVLLLSAIGFQSLAAANCSDWREQANAYQSTFKQTHQSLLGNYIELEDKAATWFAEYVAYRGHKRTFPLGNFTPLIEYSEVVFDRADFIFDQSEIFRTQVEELVTVLESCTNADKGSVWLSGWRKHNDNARKTEEVLTIFLETYASQLGSEALYWQEQEGRPVLVEYDDFSLFQTAAKESREVMGFHQKLFRVHQQELENLLASQPLSQLK